jgi:hypothetical protein
MTTNLNFTTSTTETLRGGTDYNITQYNTQGAPTLEVNLTFTLPSTIDNDSISGIANAQTINFNVLTLADNLSIDVGYNGSATFNGQVFTNNGIMSASGYYGADVNINSNAVINNGKIDPDPVRAAIFNINADVLANNGTIGGNPGQIDIDAKVIGGNGMSFIGDYETLTLNGLVGGGQTFTVSQNSYYGALKIENPTQFNGSVIDQADSFQNATVSLADLTATSYSYVNNVLSLYNGNGVVDQLRFSDSNAFGAYQSGADIIISSTSQQGTALPLHTGV